MDWIDLALVNAVMNDDVSNQQDATIVVYWSFYRSIWVCFTCFGRQTRPSSGALLTVYTALVQRTDIVVDRWQGSISTVSPVGRNIGALYQSYIYSQKCSCRWANLSPETCRADSNISIKRSINENCCILLVAYIVVLMMHGFTSVKSGNEPSDSIKCRIFLN